MYLILYFLFYVLILISLDHQVIHLLLSRPNIGRWPLYTLLCTFYCLNVLNKCQLTALFR